MDSAALLLAARRRQDLSQRELARRAGTTQAHVSRIERREVDPGFETLSRLLLAAGEHLELRSRPLPRSNARTEDLRRDFLELNAGERIAQAMELSRMLTGIRPWEPADA